MPAATAYGTISAFEAYTLDQLARIFGKDKEWVRDQFIRPIDRKTKQRRLHPETGEPLTGVRHVRLGWDTVVCGQDIINWLAQYGEIEET